MATPLVVQQALTTLPVKTPSKSQRAGGAIPSVVDRNRVEPKTRATGQKTPLEVANRKPRDTKTERPERLSYRAKREEMPLTFKGYPKSRFKGRVQPNVPL